MRSKRDNIRALYLAVRYWHRKKRRDTGHSLVHFCVCGSFKRLAVLFKCIFIAFELEHWWIILITISHKQYAPAYQQHSPYYITVLYIMHTHNWSERYVNHATGSNQSSISRSATRRQNNKHIIARWIITIVQSQPHTHAFYTIHMHTNAGAFAVRFGPQRLMELWNTVVSGINIVEFLDAVAFQLTISPINSRNLCGLKVNMLWGFYSFVFSFNSGLCQINKVHYCWGETVRPPVVLLTKYR